MKLWLNFLLIDSSMQSFTTKNFSDLKDVEDLMENAKSGILFLMFNPGPKKYFF